MSALKKNKYFDSLIGKITVSKTVVRGSNPCHRANLILNNYVIQKRKNHRIETTTR